MTHERQYSEDTAKIIDDEIEALVTEAAVRAREVIKANKPSLEKLKDALLEKETIDDKEVAALLISSHMPKTAALY